MLSDRRTLSLGATSMGHLGRTQKSQAATEKKLKAYARELEQKLEARTRELAEARGALPRRSSGRRQLRRCCASSPAPPESWSRYSKPCWRTQCASARRSS